MPEIKTKEHPIKEKKHICSEVIDKAKTSLINIKEKTEPDTEDQSSAGNEYAIDKIEQSANQDIHNAASSLEQYGKHGFEKTKYNIWLFKERQIEKANKQHKPQIKIKSPNCSIKQTLHSTSKMTIKTTSQLGIRANEKTIKTAEKNFSSCH